MNRTAHRETLLGSGTAEDDVTKNEPVVGLTLSTATSIDWLALGDVFSIILAI